jgi:hypothetical protein
LHESCSSKGFLPAATQKLHEQKRVKSYQNEHARQCPQIHYRFNQIKLYW